MSNKLKRKSTRIKKNIVINYKLWIQIKTIA